jgi:uncharacterized OsmC-like protein|tara:strand:- start:57 stop:503 length:447 start_codon:yes stop_codon:yes gene_type:complete
MSNLRFSVNGESNSTTQFVAKARHFKLVVDEPEELGGADEAANPVEYILAGLAGCINVVGHLVAKELGFVISKLNIDISGEINPDKLLGISNHERAGFQSIQINLNPETEADIVTLSQWLKIVEDRCPVKDNLRNETPVRLSVEKVYS